MTAYKDDIEKVRALIRTSRNLVSEGRQVDLAPMEERVRGLCAAITQADAAEQPALAEKIVELIADLDGLAQQLTEQFGTLGPEAVRRAASAYGRKDEGKD